MTLQHIKDHELQCRDALFARAKRIVIKVGSAVLTSSNSMNLEVIENIAKEISFLHSSGREVILVSSGAVAAGKNKISFIDDRDISLQEKQALAAIGQSHLMHIYDSAFLKHGKNIAQALLTHADLAHRDRYVNFKNTIFTLLKMGVIPIINENDTVATEELQFGDNDNLGALVTNLIEADMFICLTDVDCLYTANPGTDSTAEPVHTVVEVNEDIERMAGHSKSALGTGGMRSKILAAKKVAAGGGSSFIGPGRMEGILQKIFSGEMIGTFFLPQGRKLQGRKQWIAFVLKPKGILELDCGAGQAICCNGRSLLPSGIVSVKGKFNVGESVQCVDSEGRIIAIGTTNYRAEEIDRIKGSNSGKIQNILGHRESDVVIHRDNLVIL
ncbi:glutamate 5-kinase [Desulfopila inferna]|uniref:glutamate 5-kinase n=1 Tax=Desulfopila inferna TaxID=468528 RepID=UPI001964C0AA|nr:glutamate 5-kinase [Desulfopila inferna]MBM9602770.1 glutamate 5-kinase [Desulfopila inferna]